MVFIAGDVHYIVCRNEAETKKDRADRLAIVDGLQRWLKQGEKVVVTNTGYYRPYLRRSGEGAAFEINATSWPRRPAMTASSCSCGTWWGRWYCRSPRVSRATCTSRCFAVMASTRQGGCPRTLGNTGARERASGISRHPTTTWCCGRTSRRRLLRRVACRLQ